ncbi:MAG: DNA translocase FtsK [Chloroflexi bacterium]|nr:DNA translocase FtsK [Chloroflexota bacterium]
MARNYDLEYKAKRKSGGARPLRLVRFFLTPPGLYLTLIVALAGIIYLQREQIVKVTISWARYLVGLFGWGLVFPIIALVALVWIVSRRKLLTTIRHGNYLLGAVAVILAAWGILSFRGLGGSLGQDIIGQADFLGILRIAAFSVIGFVLVAPGLSFRLVKAAVLRTIGRFRRIHLGRPKPVPVPWPAPESLASPTQQTQSTQQTPKTPVARRLVEKLEPRKRTPAPVVPVPSSPQQLKEVAQEVWKKYGEAPDGVVVDGWRLPPIDILDKSPEMQFSQADNEKRSKLIEEALASYGVEAKVVQINAGPTVTQFGIEPGWDRRMKEVRVKDKDGKVTVKQEEVSRTRVKVDRITSLSNDLALALAASSIRIEAPVPGKSIVGVEVPNTISSLVSLRGVIETNVFQKVQSKAKMAIALGKGAGGEAVAADLAKMPHLLIAGSTGSGKTVCLNAIISCLLLTNSPNDVRFLMIDPKRVELTTFNTIPHLAAPVIVDADKAVLALRGLTQEMNKRYQILAADSSRNIESYNKNKQGKDRMPYLVLIVDELADLMMTAGDEVEQTLCRLAQLARAVGIHLVVATQRPSVDVVTGLIKANFPTRISFAVTSQVDSRTILDMVGAEKLLGSGDMLFMPTEAAKPKRLQGCYVSDAEAERLVYFWGGQRKGETSPLLKIEELAQQAGSGGKDAYPDDALLREARQLALEHEHISTSFLQRRLHIGYPRAARLMEQLEEEMGEGEVEEDLEEEGEQV